MFALIALSSNSQISFQKSISLPNLLRIAEQRKSIDIEIVLSLDKKLLVKGVGNKIGTCDYLGQPVPLHWGVNFNEN